MKDGLLDDIIRLEKQLQEDVAAEARRAGTWCARELAGLEAAAAVQSAEEAQQRSERLVEAEQAAAAEAAAVAEEARRRCIRLAEFDESVLRRVLARHLVRILPESENDHPHGEG